MARSDRSRRISFVVAFVVSALGLGAAGACSAVPDVVYVIPDASSATDVRTDGPSPTDTGAKDTGPETGSCGATICCGDIPCVGCGAQQDCAACNNTCLQGEVCCKKGPGAPVDCKKPNQC